MFKRLNLFILTTIVCSLLVACNKQESEQPSGETSESTASSQITLPAGVTLLEDYVGSDDEFAISYGKYQLANGLTVILHEDHSDPMVHVDVAYHVGSSREEPGRSGFAHFFEHMMFEGSAHVKGGDHSKIVSNAGGSMNGTTNSDRTNYYETMPLNHLEIALWLEADRMGFLLQAVDEESFEVQRETVKNERGQRVDNAPYGRWSETVMKNLYPKGHPYSWPVIGWTEDLQAATLDDLERFFLRWYGPNNAQLAVGGDLDRQQTLEWIAKYFGPIPRGPEVQTLEQQPGELESDRYITMEDNIHLPAIAMLIPTVSYFHEDEAPLDAAAKIIGQGKASLLYQSLVQSGRAVSASVSHACRELACEMAFIVVQNPSSGETLAEMETAVRDTWSEFIERGVLEDDLNKFKAQIESGRIFGMQSLAGKMGALSFSEMFNGDPKVVQDDLKRYSAVTPQQVTDAFKKYIENQPAVILSIVPNGQAALAAREQNYTAPSVTPGGEQESSAESTEAASETATQLRTVQDSFDRSIQPVPGNNPIVQLPPIWEGKLANGVRILSVPNMETPTVSLQVSFDMGQRDEPIGKAGLASLTTRLMNEATTKRTAAEFSEALERIGASLGVGSDQYQTSINLNVLSKHLDAGMELLMERLLEPAFTEEDFNRVKSQTLEGLIQATKSGPALASRATSGALTKVNNPLRYPGGGLPSTLENISLEDVKSFYAAHIPINMLGLTVSTSLPQEDINRVVAGLGELQVAPSSRESLEPLDEITGRTIYLVDKAGAAQSSVRIAHPSLSYDALGDYFRAGLMNFNLGGTFDSRINLNLREDKGWSYGTNTRFRGGQEFGIFQFSGEINHDATKDAIVEALGEMERFASEGMTEEEYQYMQNAVGQSDAMQYETPGRKLGLINRILIYDLPLNYRSQQKTLLQETDRETLNALAAELLQPENVAIIVVGDAAELRPELEKLQWPIRMMDEEGFEIAE